MNYKENEKKSNSYNYLDKLLECNKEEWFKTGEGSQYKARLEQLDKEKKAIDRDVDVKLSMHLETKYGQMD